MSCADLAHSRIGEKMVRAIFIFAAAANISACTQPANESRTSTVQIFTPKKTNLTEASRHGSIDLQKSISPSAENCKCADQSITLPDGTVVAPLSCKLNASCFNFLNPPAHLHIKQTTTCYVVYGEYYVEAKTTAGVDPDGPGVPTENLSMAWRVNGQGGNKPCGTDTFCAHSDRVLGQCVTSLCSKAQMIINGQKVTVGVEENCKV